MALTDNDSKANQKMKQKSLMSFFGKQPVTKPSTSAVSEPKTQANTGKGTRKSLAPDASLSSPVVVEARTPLSKTTSQSSAVTSAMYTRSSDGGFSAHDTPPTSDPIDVDMLSDEEELGSMKSAKRPVTMIAFIVTRLVLIWPIVGDRESQAQGCG